MSRKSIKDLAALETVGAKNASLLWSEKASCLFFQRNGWGFRRIEKKSRNVWTIDSRGIVDQKKLTCKHTMDLRRGVYARSVNYIWKKVRVFGARRWQCCVAKVANSQERRTEANKASVEYTVKLSNNSLLFLKAKSMRLKLAVASCRQLRPHLLLGRVWIWA